MDGRNQDIPCFGQIVLLSKILTSLNSGEFPKSVLNFPDTTQDTQTANCRGPINRQSAVVRLRLRLRLSPRILVKRALENLTTALGTLLEGCYGASRTTASVHQSSSAPNWSLRLLKYCTDIRARSYIYIYTHRSLHSTYIVA